MDLNELFETQKKLDEHIEQEKGLQGQDLLDKKILALQVELGELANEWREFKFWKEDNEPRTFEPNPNDICEKCNGKPIFIENNQIAGQCDYCDGVGVHFYNPLLEEYVDCLHFILSIGNDLKIGEVEISCDFTKETITETFNEMFRMTSGLTRINHKLIHVRNRYYHELINLFIGLGELQLGFTWQEIKQAYYDKNKINHERQVNGY